MIGLKLTSYFMVITREVFLGYCVAFVNLLNANKKAQQMLRLFKMRYVQYLAMKEHDAHKNS